MKLSKISRSYYVIIPKEIVEKILKWETGTKLTFEIREENNEKILIIKPKINLQKSISDSNKFRDPQG